MNQSHDQKSSLRCSQEVKKPLLVFWNIRFILSCVIHSKESLEICKRVFPWKLGRRVELHYLFFETAELSRDLAARGYQVNAFETSYLKDICDCWMQQSSPQLLWHCMSLQYSKKPCGAWVPKFALVWRAWQLHWCQVAELWSVCESSYRQSFDDHPRY